jgi:hypothetical protein
MSDSKAALILKICVKKITKIYAGRSVKNVQRWWRQFKF